MPSLVVLVPLENNSADHVVRHPAPQASRHAQSEAGSGVRIAADIMAQKADHVVQVEVAADAQ